MQLQLRSSLPHCHQRPLSSPVRAIKDHYDAVVIGSGPVGCTFARKLVDAGQDVLMVDAGPTLSKRPGAHLKNAYKYQRDVNSFASHIKGALHTLSIPANFSAVPTLNPLAFNPEPLAEGFVRGNQNPYQKEHDNLPAAAATYGVGGMATHWTCACPRPSKVERNWLFPSEQSYQKAETLLRVNQKTFMGVSMRDSVLNKILRSAFVERTGLNPDSKEVPADKYTIGPQPLPLAAQRNKGNPECVTWTGPDIILGDELIDMAAGYTNGSRFTILDNHVCKRLEFNQTANEVKAVVLKDGLNGGTKTVTADKYVLAAGTVLTPQLLWHSLHGVDAVDKLPALGRYLTEQPMAFCQVVWRGDIMADEFEPHYKGNLALDPIPIDVHDAEPNQWLPCTADRPWHAQIHRDAFAYGEVAPNVDNRLVVDLRFFGLVEQRYENRVEFHTCAEKGVNDIFGLPQPTFHYTYNADEKLRMHGMMDEMLYYAGKIGGFLPGSEPQFTKPGLSLHIHGSTRVGQGASDSVVNKFSRVHGMSNLYLGGNGLIPKAITCNPTLTSVAYALEAAAHILGQGDTTAQS